MKWCKIKKRKTNVIYMGVDLGSESPHVDVNIIREEDFHLPKPQMPRILLSVKGRNESTWPKLPICNKEISF